MWCTVLAAGRAAIGRGHAVAGVRGAMDDAVAPERRLWEGLRSFFHFVAEHRDSWAVLYQQARVSGEPFSSDVVRARRRVMEEVDALAVRATTLPCGRRVISAKDADVVAHVVVGAADSLTDWLLDHPEESPETLALRVMNLAWVGMQRLIEGDVWRP
ncbi:AcrR family transcriptional regulator [Spinactinospora alkalitolerans]|uniref:AcrR family transcriptional regulator n=1 Tax=Spinactinospora alkalitolerans TaxID=687207 RepID=A0A852U275_9ACTN|nr:hypothetical protein [Spinactinospora alkalitolerans]NYE48080.1 AcrR family transcriptional regulator [Spinactinospora alkalitolerans]